MRCLLSGAVLCSVLALLPAASAVAAPTVTEFPIAQQDTDPLGIVAASSAVVVFAEGSVSGFGVGTSSDTTGQFWGLSGPAAGVAVADGEEWLTEPSANKIARVTLYGTALATVTQFPLSGGTQPEGITDGPDGNVWFTEAGTPAAIGKITPSGTITQYSTGLTASSQPTDITTGPDGNLWFTEAASPGRIGKVTPSGTITQYSTGLTCQQPAGRHHDGAGREPLVHRGRQPGSDREDHPLGHDHRIQLGPDRQQRPHRDHGGPRGRPVVHRVRQPRRDRLDHAAGRDLPGRDTHYQQRAHVDHRGLPRHPLVRRGWRPWSARSADPRAAGDGHRSRRSPWETRPRSWPARSTRTGFPATYQFQWGTSSSYGQSRAQPRRQCRLLAARRTRSARRSPASAPNTTYHYRLVATNCARLSDGDRRRLRT